MPVYYLQLLDHDGVRPDQLRYEFDTDQAAIEEAKRALGDMATEGLPTGDYNMLSVELFDERRKPIHEIRLILEEIDKTANTSNQ